MIGKSQSASAAALLTLSPSTDALGAEAAEAKEMLRIGAWSVRRAPGGPEAGLLYVNVETGRAQKEPPPEVLQELEVESEAEEEARRPSSGNRPGSGSRRGDSSRPGSSGGSQPAACRGDAKFRRILLGKGQDLPLRMARDIHMAIKEDSSFFDLAQERYSDAPKGEVPFDLEALPEELEAVASALGPGEISGVIGTEAGMQILLRVC